MILIYEREIKFLFGAVLFFSLSCDTRKQKQTILSNTANRMLVWECFSCEWQLKAAQQEPGCYGSTCTTPTHRPPHYVPLTVPQMSLAVRQTHPKSLTVLAEQHSWNFSRIPAVLTLQMSDESREASMWRWQTGETAARWLWVMKLSWISNQTYSNRIICGLFPPSRSPPGQWRGEYLFKQDNSVRANAVPGVWARELLLFLCPT